MSISKIRHKLISYSKEILKSNGNPESIAMGFSLGTLIAILPTPGFGIFLALFIALFFKKINKIAIVASFTLWNPLILAPIYWFSYELGDLFYTPDPSIKFDLAIFDQLYHYSGKFILGNATIALIMSTMGYVVIYTLVQKYLKKRDIQQLLEIQPQKADKAL
jgi:uncharacterized protein (DUF2062 family)